jgi:hypothetical protein
MLPYTNQEANALSKSKLKHFNAIGLRSFVNHLTHSMVVSAKLLMASIATCVNGFIPGAFKYASASICLSIIEDDLQNNRMPHATRPKQKQTSLNDSGLESALNDVSNSIDDEDKLQ